MSHLRSRDPCTSSAVPNFPSGPRERERLARARVGSPAAGWWQCRTPGCLVLICSSKRNLAERRLLGGKRVFLRGCAIYVGKNRAPSPVRASVGDDVHEGSDTGVAAEWCPVLASECMSRAVPPCPCRLSCRPAASCPFGDVGLLRFLLSASAEGCRKTQKCETGEARQPAIVLVKRWCSWLPLLQGECLRHALF